MTKEKKPPFLDRSMVAACANRYELTLKRVQGKVVTVTHTNWGDYKITLRTQGKDHQTGDPLWVKAHLSQAGRPVKGSSGKQFWSKETEFHGYVDGCQYELVSNMCRFIAEQQPYQERMFA